MVRPKRDYEYRRKFDLTLAPTWRFDYVQRKLADNLPLHPKRTDEHMNCLRQYYIAKRRLQHQLRDIEDLNDELAERFRHVWQADRIFQKGSDHRNRYEIEANILAGRQPGDIANRCNIEPHTVLFYEKVFFNVSAKLSARSYIAGTVLAPAFMAGLASKSLEMTAKYFGYFAGPHVLDLILDAFTDEISAPRQPSDLSQWIDRQFRSRMRTSALVGVTYMDPSNYNIHTLLEGFQSLLSLSNREQSQTGNDNVLNDAMGVFVRQAPAAKGDDADCLPARPGPDYGGGSIEPRIGEIDQWSRGVTAPKLITYTQDDWDNPATRNISNAATDNRQDRRDDRSGD